MLPLLLALYPILSPQLIKMSTLQWIVNDLESMIPSWGFNNSIKPLPKVGEDAPPSSLPLQKGKNSIVIFTRHIGCPFCTAEIRNLLRTARKPAYLDLQFMIVAHSNPTYEVEKFIVEELEEEIPSNVTVVGDPERKAYMAYGLGELGWGDVINQKIISQVKEMAKEGNKNRLTRGTR